MSRYTFPHDWYGGSVPGNALIDESAYLDSSFCFAHYRSEEKVGLRIGKGSSVYGGSMFNVGPKGQLAIGDFTMVNGAWIICDGRITIGDYVLISWNVVLMDSYQIAADPAARRRQLERMSLTHALPSEPGAPASPITVNANAWIGFDSCILPGVTIGEGAVIGARSVVMKDIAPYTVVAGNPARFIRNL